MKFRICVIFVCMTVVPALALFSHRLPAEVRDVARRRIWEPVEAWVSSLTRPDAKASVVATNEALPTADAPAAASADPVSPAVPSPPLAVALGPKPQSPSAVALASLGAVLIDCRPFDGIDNTHVASCRVAVDNAGQLHRIFQAAGRSPGEALDALEYAVRSWRSRVASGAAMPRL